MSAPTRQQVRGAVVLLGALLLLVLWRLWPSSSRDRRADRLRQERPGPAAGAGAPGRDRVLRQPAGVPRTRHRQREGAAAEERAEVPHHLLDVVAPERDVLGRRVRAARPRGARGRSASRPAADRGGRHRPLPAGAAAGALRRSVARRAAAPAARGGWPSASATRGCTALLARVDPEAAARISPRDRVRIVRALEVYRVTGRPITEQQRDGAEPLRGFRTLVVGLDPDRDGAAAARSRRARGRCSSAGWSTRCGACWRAGSRAESAPAAGHRLPAGARGAAGDADGRGGGALDRGRHHALREAADDVVPPPGRRPWFASPDEAAAAVRAWLDVPGDRAAG